MEGRIQRDSERQSEINSEVHPDGGSGLSVSSTQSPVNPGVLERGTVEGDGWGQVCTRRRDGNLVQSVHRPESEGVCPHPPAEFDCDTETGLAEGMRGSFPTSNCLLPAVSFLDPHQTNSWGDSVGVRGDSDSVPDAASQPSHLKRQWSGSRVCEGGAGPEGAGVVREEKQRRLNVAPSDSPPEAPFHFDQPLEEREDAGGGAESSRLTALLPSLSALSAEEIQAVLHRAEMRLNGEEEKSSPGVALGGKGAEGGRDSVEGVRSARIAEERVFVSMGGCEVRVKSVGGGVSVGTAANAPSARSAGEGVSVSTAVNAPSARTVAAGASASMERGELCAKNVVGGVFANMVGSVAIAKRVWGGACVKTAGSAPRARSVEGGAYVNMAGSIAGVKRVGGGVFVNMAGSVTGARIAQRRH
eukprot:Cvel_15605.t1-p1 / transcript=Cvel_15605.t1 / gene=Cvel_15605 / organism=Chromera_velia_CCMP2878 / gene_product=Zinc finger protein 571, putative / transcript_product=Zinc finger protein 571, putative / location=Cvel_scaffold1161:19868-21776(-) / protein_length=415 / sequence_SO=supercontig / SO=protein_coding / is_pseudo=false